jgi:hypothetical protein
MENCDNLCMHPICPVWLKARSLLWISHEASERDPCVSAVQQHNVVVELNYACVCVGLVRCSDNVNHAVRTLMSTRGHWVSRVRVGRWLSWCVRGGRVGSVGGELMLALRHTVPSSLCGPWKKKELLASASNLRTLRSW